MYAHPINKYVAYGKLQSNFRAFNASINSVKIPRNVIEAFQSPEWKKAMEEEIKAFDIEEIEKLKMNLAKEFEIKDLGSMRYFLGMEVTRSEEGLVINQRKYVLDLLAEIGMLDCKPVKTLMEPGLKFCKDRTGNPINKETYQRLVGKLIYLSLTRPDISYSVSIINQHMSDPREEHLEAVNRILRFLKFTSEAGLIFRKNQDKTVKVYTDASWGGELTDRRSVSGYCAYVWGNLVTWRSKKQVVVSRSSAESEFRAMALGISKNPIQHDRTKHIEIDRHFIYEKVNNGVAQLQYIPTKKQLADIFTKALPRDPNGGYGGGPGQAKCMMVEKLMFKHVIQHLIKYASMLKTSFLDQFASLLNILDDELAQNVGNYILRCFKVGSSTHIPHSAILLLYLNISGKNQSVGTYEGGISGEPGSEAHGGYTFCGLATMILINEVDRLDLSSLIGGIFALLKRLNSTRGEKSIPLGDGEDSGPESPQITASTDATREEGLNEDLSQDQHDTSSRVNVDNVHPYSSKGHAKVEPLFNSLALQQYILLCSQDLNGGLRDKPGKSRDHYHTCYCLSGLSVCQRSWSESEDSPPLPRAVLDHDNQDSRTVVDRCAEVPEINRCIVIGPSNV
ncbi:Prenyltransferase family protein isoform 2 [Hibiscus syriacus]|uniref:Prenyltransferase family protein isoform 2 n=1 Tax=Hibiscus syriacus TaxID=106335 RepID=A0A6A2Y9Y3_HIBSY|nr:Prenyltransferase family protein isoform 2 [Hibiscus syriacus]